jgi:hypothetical protein
MTHLLLEDPKYLLFLLVVIDLVLIFLLKKIPFEKKKISIIIITLIIPAVHILAKVVETDNEKIENNLIKISQNANRLQIDSVTPFIDSNFVAEYENENYNKKEFIAFLKEKVGKKIINGINFKKNKISFTKNKAETVITSYVDITTTEGVYRLPLRWDITWIKKSNSWYMFKTKKPQMVKF